MIRAIVGWCTLSVAVAVGAADDSAARLQGLQREIGAGERRIEQTSAERKSIESELQRAEIELAGLRRRDAQLAAELRTAERQLAALDRRRGAIEEVRDQQLRQLSDDIAIAYRLGGEEPLQMLLNLEDPEAVDRMLRYYGYFVAARAEQLAGYRQTMAELAAITDQADAERARLLAGRTALKQERQRQDELVDRRRSLVAALDARLADEQDRVRKLRAESERLQRVLKRLSRAAEPTGDGPFASQIGQLPWPVAGRLLNRYGGSREGALRWSGWMIAVEDGAQVHAVHAGKVVFSDYLRGHGQLIIVDHGGGYLTLYAHNQALLATAGDRVEGGAVIARAGNSGGLGQSALYFEVRQGSKTLDPGRWLRKGS